jgi:hypothetical protein
MAYGPPTGGSGGVRGEGDVRVAFVVGQVQRALQGLGQAPQQRKSRHGVTPLHPGDLGLSHLSPLRQLRLGQAVSRILVLRKTASSTIRCPAPASTGCARLSPSNSKRSSRSLPPRCREHGSPRVVGRSSSQAPRRGRVPAGQGSSRSRY